MMNDGNLGDSGTLPGSIDRNEAVHLAIEFDVLDYAFVVCLQRASIVVKADAGDARNQAVRQPTRQVARQRRILACPAPTRDHVVAFVQLGQQPWDIHRIVLQVAVHRNDDVATREIDARHHRGGLPVIAAQVNYFDVRVRGGDLVERGSGSVGAAVIDEYQFPWSAQALENDSDRFVERNDAFDFVEYGNGDGDHGWNVTLLPFDYHKF